jgi:hypothetical protein
MAGTDFIALAQAGATLRTRDRREVTVVTIDAASGRISGQVAMVGTCHWQRDGLLEKAPGGSAGPLDLAPPARASLGAPQRASLQDALADPSARNACCD